MRADDTEFELKLPQKVLDAMGVKAGTPLQLTVDTTRAVIQPTPLVRVRQRRADYVWPLVTSVITAIGVYVYWILSGFRSIALTGDYSVGSFVIGTSLISGSLLFIAFFIRNRNSGSPLTQRMYWRHFPAVIISFVIMLLLLVLGAFWLLGTLFPGAVFDLATGILIFLVFSLLANTMMVEFADSISAQTLTLLLTFVIISGVVISMASNGTRRWWQHNLSFLGTDLATNAWQFNLTLVLSGLLLITLIDYLFVSLQAQRPNNKRLIILRALLTLIAIDVMLVGIFPNNADFHILHDEVADLLVTLITLLIILLRWIMPGVTRGFLWGSYIMAALLLALNVGFRLFRYPSLTAFEIQAFALAFVWLILLFERLRELIDAGVVSWQVTVEKSDSDEISEKTNRPT